MLYGNSYLTVTDSGIPSEFHQKGKLVLLNGSVDDSRTDDDDNETNDRCSG